MPFQENTSQSKLKRGTNDYRRLNLIVRQNETSVTSSYWFRTSSPDSIQQKLDLDTKSRTQKGHALGCLFSGYCIVLKRQSLKVINMERSLTARAQVSNLALTIYCIKLDFTFLLLFDTKKQKLFA